MLKFNRIIQWEKPRLKNTIFALKPSINVDCLVSDVSEFLREKYLNNNCLKLMIVFPSSLKLLGDGNQRQSVFKPFKA